MVINTNIEAQRTAGNLLASQQNLQRSLSRLSSGSKIINASDDAAGLAVSSRLESQIRRMESVRNNLGNAMSLTQTQDGFIQNIDHALTRMSELAMLAQDSTKQDDDLALYNEEFQQLMDYILATRDKDFNGVDLFDGSVLNITIDTDGNTFPVGGIDLKASVFESALKKQSWELSTEAWEVSKSGYLLNQDTYQLDGTAYKLNSDLWFNGTTWETSQPLDGNGDPDAAYTKYDAGTFIQTTADQSSGGSTIAVNPPAANVLKLDAGHYTTENLADPNVGNGLFASTTYSGDGTVNVEKQFTLRSSGSFVAAEPYGSGDLNYNNRTPVAAGRVVNIDPTASFANATAEDASATKYFQGATIESQEDLSAFATDSGGVRISTFDSAKSALTVIQAALDQLHIERASLGAIQQRIEFTSQQMIASQQNLSEAKSRITDVDMAAETTEYAKQQILVQSGTQMLREANRLPQTALELLR
jgi:flagellin